MANNYNPTNRSGKNQPCNLTWEPFPLIRVFSRGVFVLVALCLLLSGHLQSAMCLLFSVLLMDLLEGYLDIFEYKTFIKTGILDHKLKYFVFWNGGVAVIWLAIRILLPHGMKNIVGLSLWLVLFFLHLITFNSASKAANHRVFKIEPHSPDKM